MTGSVRQDTYEALYALLDTLPSFKAAEVRELWAQAVSYVWGYQDAGGPSRDSLDASAFGLCYAWHCARFANDEAALRRSIQDCFIDYREGRAL